MFIKGIDSNKNEILVNTAYIVSLETPDNEEFYKDYYYVRLLYRDGFNLNSIYLRKDDMDAYTGMDRHNLLRFKIMDQIYGHKKED